MAFAGRPGRAAERDAVIERHVIADLGGLADDDAGAVIDEEAVSDRRARMDIDIGEKAGQTRTAAAPESASRPHRRWASAIPDDGVNARIGQQRFQFAAGRGIAQAHAGDILPDQLQQRRRRRRDRWRIHASADRRNRTCMATSRAVGNAGDADLAPDRRQRFAVATGPLWVDRMLAHAGKNGAQLVRRRRQVQSFRATP